MATEAQIRANRLNAQKSTGPKTDEGKERSRANSLKHGMTGAGIVLSQADGAEVTRRINAFAEELKPTSAVEAVIVRYAAVCSIRMDRGCTQEVAALAGRLREVETEFQDPKGTEPAAAVVLKAEATARALFDPSKDATLARKYEAAAARGFFRALKELRDIRKHVKETEPAVEVEAFRQELASILAVNASDDAFYARYADLLKDDPFRPDLMPKPGVSMPPSGHFGPRGDAFEAPFAVGKPR